MIGEYLCLTAFVIADLIWWRIVDSAMRRQGRARFWRALVAVFALVEISYVVAFYLDRVPVSGFLAWRLMVYLWHILVLPATLLVMLAAWGIARLRRAAPVPAEARVAPAANPEFRVSRRDALGVAAAALLPPLVTAATSIYAYRELGGFNVRRLELRVPGLPADLDGLTIAHVTDLHIGIFLPRGMAEKVAEATNAMRADLVAFTGDVLDNSSTVVKPGIDFIRRLDPRHGLVMIEGNHDVLRGADRFEKAVKDAGLPLLLDESATFRVPGRSTPVQFLGIVWGDMRFGREVNRFGYDSNLRFREPSDQARADSIRRVLAMRDPAAFPIVLAHHPHAFDPAAASGLPLVLAGHTHGGQLMLTKNIGAGPLRFRYWTGVYRKPSSRLFVSNGVGNWFPLRINAPPEIVHLTLRQDDVTNA